MMYEGIEKIRIPLGYDDPAWGPVAIPLHPRSMEKIAGSSHTPQKLLDFMDRIRPRDDGRYVLLNAIGAYEFWGNNSNADAFPEWSLRGDPIPEQVKQFCRERSLTVPSDWGCSTFERYAYPFRHHNNKDPMLSIGERVCCAAYNDHMHRVELIVFILTSKAPDVVQRIDDGIPVPWSMGARLPWDCCSVCLKISTRIEDYCIHLKDMKNQILPNGEKVFSWNYFPRFFDISAVVVPADKSAYSLRKVASANPYLGIEAPSAQALVVPEGMSKYASILDYLAAGGEKRADIIKEIPAQAPAKDLGESPIDPDVWRILFDLVSRDSKTSETMPQELDALKGTPPASMLSALTSLGIILKPEEADGLLGDQEVPEALDLQQPDPTLLSRIKGLVPKRSLFDPMFSERVLSNMSPSTRENRPALVKRSNSTAVYASYVSWLRHMDLDRLETIVSHPSIQIALDPSSVEARIIGLEKTAHSFPKMARPFIAGISLGC